jgi:chromosome segregation ATPase
LRHVIEHASAARERAIELLSRLEVEAADLRVEAERADRARTEAEDALSRGRATLEDNALARAAQESELAAARSERDRLAAELRTREHELAGREARLRSLQEIDAAHAEYGDAARLVLSEPSAGISHQGAVADHLEVERGWRAVEACLGHLRTSYDSHDAARRSVTVQARDAAADSSS